MSKVHPIDFGKVRYEPGAPKNVPGWIWRGGCDRCRELPFPQGIHGPFKTARDAEREAHQALSPFYYADTGERHQGPGERVI